MCLPTACSATLVAWNMSDETITLYSMEISHFYFFAMSFPSKPFPSPFIAFAVPKTHTPPSPLSIVGLDLLAVLLVDAS